MEYSSINADRLGAPCQGAPFFICFSLARLN